MERVDQFVKAKKVREGQGAVALSTSLSPDEFEVGSGKTQKSTGDGDENSGEGQGRKSPEPVTLASFYQQKAAELKNKSAANKQRVSSDVCSNVETTELTGSFRRGTSNISNTNQRPISPSTPGGGAQLPSSLPSNNNQQQSQLGGSGGGGGGAFIPSHQQVTETIDDRFVQLLKDQIQYNTEMLKIRLFLLMGLCSMPSEERQLGSRLEELQQSMHLLSSTTRSLSVDHTNNSNIENSSFTGGAVVGAELKGVLTGADMTQSVNLVGSSASLIAVSENNNSGSTVGMLRRGGGGARSSIAVDSSPSPSKERLMGTPTSTKQKSIVTFDTPATQQAEVSQQQQQLQQQQQQPPSVGHSSKVVSHALPNTSTPLIVRLPWEIDSMFRFSYEELFLRWTAKQDRPFSLRNFHLIMGDEIKSRRQAEHAQLVADGISKRLHAELDAAKHKIEYLTEQHNEKLKQYLIELNLTRSRVMDLQRKVDEPHHPLPELLDVPERANSNSDADIESQRQKQQHEKHIEFLNRKLTEECALLNHTLQQRQELIRILEGELSTTRTELNTVRTEYRQYLGSQEIVDEELKQIMSELETTAENLKDANGVLETKLAEKQQEVDRAVKAQSELQLQLRASHEEIRALGKERDRIRAMYDVAQKQVDKLNVELADAKADVKKAFSMLDEAKEEAAKERAEKERLLARPVVDLHIHLEVKNKLDEVTAKIGEMELILKETTTERDRLLKEKKSLTDQLTIVNKDFSDFKKQTARQEDARKKKEEAAEIERQRERDREKKRYDSALDEIRSLQGRLQHEKLLSSKAQEALVHDIMHLHREANIIEKFIKKQLDSNSRRELAKKFLEPDLLHISELKDSSAETEPNADEEKQTREEETKEKGKDATTTSSPTRTPLQLLLSSVTPEEENEIVSQNEAKGLHTPRTAYYFSLQSKFQSEDVMMRYDAANESVKQNLPSPQASGRSGQKQLNNADDLALLYRSRLSLDFLKGLFDRYKNRELNGETDGADNLSQLLNQTPTKSPSLRRTFQEQQQDSSPQLKSENTPTRFETESNHSAARFTSQPSSPNLDGRKSSSAHPDFELERSLILGQPLSPKKSKKSMRGDGSSPTNNNTGTALGSEQSPTGAANMASSADFSMMLVGTFQSLLEHQQEQSRVLLEDLQSQLDQKSRDFDVLEKEFEAYMESHPDVPLDTLGGAFGGKGGSASGMEGTSTTGGNGDSLTGTAKLLWQFPGLEHAAEFYDLYEAFGALHLQLSQLVKICEEDSNLTALLAKQTGGSSTASSARKRNASPTGGVMSPFGISSTATIQGPAELIGDAELEQKKEVLHAKFITFRGIEAFTQLILHRLKKKKEDVLRCRSEELEKVLQAVQNISRTRPKEFRDTMKLMQHVQQQEHQQLSAAPVLQADERRSARAKSPISAKGLNSLALSATQTSGGGVENNDVPQRHHNLLRALPRTNVSRAYPNNSAAAGKRDASGIHAVRGPSPIPVSISGVVERPRSSSLGLSGKTNLAYKTQPLTQPQEVLVSGATALLSLRAQRGGSASTNRPASSQGSS